MRKGILVIIIGIIISAMMPFSIYAAGQSQISPTFSSTTSQWSTHLYVTNFSDGTNTQASSTLSFTFDDDYYGMIYFDGYGPSNQHIANFAVCFVAGGYGEYRYSFYQNGVINITSVTIQIVKVVKPQSSVDLTQIITLLTAIENDTSSIDNVLDTTLAQIRLVLAELIESNGYLETLTELRQWNIPYESLNFIFNTFLYGYEFTSVFDFNYFQFPIFKFDSAHTLIDSYNYYGNVNDIHNKKTFILYIERNIWRYDEISNFFSITDRQGNIIPSSDYLIDNFEILQQRLSSGLSLNQGTLIKFDLSNISGTTQYFNLNYIGTINDNIYWIPIYSNISKNNFISTDFALIFGLSNSLLDDLHIIANGTAQSNSAASDLESGNNQMSSDMNSLATIESGYNQDFNSQLQNIDFSNPITNNQGLLPAANFVITVFNGLINNNPLSVLIIVCCILLIGKRVIGK